MIKFQHFLERFKQGVFVVDYLVLSFSLVLLIISILLYSRLGQPLIFTTANIVIILLTLYLIIYEEQNIYSIHYWLHSWLPILTFSFYYTQCTSYDNLIFKITFDPVLIGWETRLFGNLEHLLALPGQNLMADEIMHFFYFSYYLILFVPGMIMFLRRHPKTHEMIFSLTLMMYAHYVFFMFFPTDGPIFKRPEIFQNGFLFIPIMNLIYRLAGDQGGGAFPSTHVTTAVMMFFYSFDGFKNNRWLIQLLAIGIISATVYCSYHYAVDAIAGIITGTFFYYLGKSIYDSPRLLRKNH